MEKSIHSSAGDEGGKLGRIGRLRQGLILEVNTITSHLCENHGIWKMLGKQEPWFSAVQSESSSAEPLSIFLKQHIWNARPGDSPQDRPFPQGSTRVTMTPSDSVQRSLARGQGDIVLPQPQSINRHCLLRGPGFNFQRC